MFPCFAREFFTKRQFMLEEHSLEALIHIANHPNLCKYLKFVIISAEKINQEESVDRLRLLGYKDSQTLIWTGQARDMLVEAFQKLPNLQTVSVRDYSGPGRYRDGEHARWRSYGWSIGVENQYESESILEHTGGPPLYFKDVAKLTFPLVIEALAAAQVNPKGIEVFLNKRQALEANSFNLFRGRLGPRVREMAEKLKRLLLVVGSEQVLLPWNPSRIRPIQDFLLAADHLETLRLNMMFGVDEDPLLRWLSERPFPPGQVHHHGPNKPTFPLPSPPTFPHLHQLDLGFACLTNTTLAHLLTSFRLLQRISLWKIRLLGPPGIHDTPSLAKKRWPALLRMLAKALRDDGGGGSTAPITSLTLSGVSAGAPPNILRGDESVEVHWKDLAPSERVLYGDGREDAFGCNPPRSCTKVEFRSGTGRGVSEWLMEAAERVSYGEEESAWEIAENAAEEEETSETESEDSLEGYDPDDLAH
jgi:hypothetical protein